MWTYDLDADTWAKKGHRRAARLTVGLLAYDPLSGLVVAWGTTPTTTPAELWTYDVATDAWTPIPQANR